MRCAAWPGIGRALGERGDVQLQALRARLEALERAGELGRRWPAAGPAASAPASASSFGTSVRGVAGGAGGVG